MQLTGIHHLTAISAKPCENLAFYTGLPGMRWPGRARAACITSRFARPTIGNTTPGRSGSTSSASATAARSTGSIFGALFPRAERHPVRDRHRRTRLRHRRADGNARRETGVAAVPGTAPHPDRSRVEAARVNWRKRAFAHPAKRSRVIARSQRVAGMRAR